MTKLNIERTKLFDGLEIDELYQKNFKVHQLTFKILDFIENPLDKLNDNISEDDYQRIGELFNARSEFSRYFKRYKFDVIPLKSEENLLLYFLLKESQIYIFSFGEKQPGRYMLFLKGIWSSKK